MKQLIVIPFLLLICFSGVSQQNKKVDSLYRLLEKGNSQKELFNIYKELFGIHLYSSLDSASWYLKKIKDVAEAGKDIDLLYEYNLMGAKYYFFSSNIDSALTYTENATVFAERLEDESLKADSYNKLAILNNFKGRDSLVWSFLDKSLESAKKVDDWRLLASIYVSIGNIKANYNMYPEALSYYLKIDSLSTANNTTDKLLAAVYINTGEIYLKLDKTKAVDYFKKGLTVYEKLDLPERIASTKGYLGRALLEVGDKENAVVHLEEALKFYRDFDNKQETTPIYLYLAKIYSEEKPVLAESYFQIAKQQSEELGIFFMRADAGTEMGDFFLKINEPEKAIEQFAEVLELRKSQESEEKFSEYIMYANQGLATAYEDLGEYKKALTFLKSKILISDSITSTQNQKQFQELEKKYQTEKKEQEIELLTSNASLAEQKSKNQRNLLLGGISILGLSFLVLFILFKNKQKTTDKLKELEAAKSRFFTNISHEFRTPLTLISGPVAHQLTKKELSNDDKTDLGLIQRNSNRLLELVDQLLDISKIEAGHRTLKVSKGNLGLFLKQLLESFEYQAKQKELSFTKNITINTETWYDRDLMQKVITNLMSNAIKHCSNEGMVQFEANTSNEKLQLIITNTNDTLSEDELRLLFDRFYQKDAMAEGVGIGLSLVNELVQLSKGTINASKPHSGTIQFEVLMPVRKSAFTKTELLFNEGSYEKHGLAVTLDYPEDINTENEEEQNKELPLLLAVDDNEEIVLFIRNLFKREYRILEATNGQEGIEKALKFVPDLIISDVMMPIKDGISLSRTLKSDERTSHIPIILLTAKSGEEHELAGLKTGADSYITKPFKEEKLRVLIEKMIATRKAIQKKFGKQVYLKPKEIQLTSTDTVLMERIQKVLDEELINPDFSAAAFSEKVGLSRMHLHRKLKALTGFSTTEFIRVQRLKLAAKILRDSDVNISEVGYSVGFNQPAYFSTSFKEYFKVSPKEYSKQNMPELDKNELGN
ncbi:MAG: response regulator [Bacteroidota bacterium]